MTQRNDSWGPIFEAARLDPNSISAKLAPFLSVAYKQSVLRRLDIGLSMMVLSFKEPHSDKAFVHVVPIKSGIYRAYADPITSLHAESLGQGSAEEVVRIVLRHISRTLL